MGAGPVEDTLLSDKLVTHLQKLSKYVKTEPSNIELHFMFCLNDSSPGDVWHTLSELAEGSFGDSDLPTRRPKFAQRNFTFMDNESIGKCGRNRTMLVS